MTNHEIWQACLGELELTINKTHFLTWFKNTTIIASDNGRVTVGVPNMFAKEWLENKYNKEIFRALQHVTNSGVRQLAYEITSLSSQSAKQKASPLRQHPNQHSFESYQAPSSQVTAQPSQQFNSNLNPKYKFETFVVGANNELARAACLAVAENLGRAYNPLFIYGGVGLGKTHLLQSIGNRILEKDPGKKVRYVQSESFTNEVVEAIRNQTMNSLKDKYRTVDLLIIDDVQFLATKEKTQEEFFYTFNALYQENKQIVISSDRPPKAIPTLEERLRSRFEGGMIADIGAPDFETRMAILQNRIIEKKFTIDKEVLTYIASNIQSNVRELEGAINRIIATCQYNSTEPTMENAKRILTNIITNPTKRATTIQNVIDVVASFYSINTDDITGKSRKKEIVRPRQITMFLIREELKASFPLIGQEIGGKDHTTAMHAYQKIKKEIEKEETTRQELELIKQRVYQGQ
jgi:chromosomal replication initiator protein